MNVYKIKLTRKCHMTLVEVLVAMSILSILLTVIFGFFRELSKLDEFTHHQQTKTFQRRYLEFRLSYLFSRLINEKDSQKKFFFFLDHPDPSAEVSEFNSLVFTYNNGVRLDPAFSGDLLARLYVNKNNQLCLVSWPSVSADDPPPYGDMQKEILLDNVAGIRFDFFAALPKNSSTPPSINGPIKGSWQEEWSLAYKQMPSLLKTTLMLKEQKKTLQKNQEQESKEPLLEKLEFVFYLPIAESTDNYIYYK
jgi:hypothetical protein